MQFGAHAAGVGGRTAVAVRPGAVERAGDDARGGGLADAAHAGQHEGVGDAAGGEGVAQGAHHRLLADQVVEAVAAGICAPARGRAPPRAPGRRAVAEQAGAVGRRGRAGRRGGGSSSEQAGHARRAPTRGASGIARWEAGQTTRAETRCGCFLPDLTGLARRPSAADLPRHISCIRRPGARLPVQRRAWQGRAPLLTGSPVTPIVRLQTQYLHRQPARMGDRQARGRGLGRRCAGRARTRCSCRSGAAAT